MRVDETITVEADERILWVGRPDPRAHFARWDWFLVPFSIVWTTLAVVTMLSAITHHAPWVAVIVTGVMVAFGAYLCVGRFAVKAHVNRATRYWLTSQRAIIRRGGRENSIELSADNIRMTKSPRSGRVDVVFGRNYGPWAGAGLGHVLSPWANSGLDFLLALPGAPFAFYDLSDGIAVLEALHAAGIDLQDRGLSPAL